MCLITRSNNNQDSDGRNDEENPKEESENLQEISRKIRYRIYSCGFCLLISRLPNGPDSLESEDKWFYLDHLKREHGLRP
jgi:hypothetical protein